jgi:AcrR family transcriptional regulator
MDPVNPVENTERTPRLSTKPLRADAARNRAKVLTAAQEAFAAEGLAVPLDEIARRAGVGAGTVYRHFPTKEALFEAVMLDRVTRLVDYTTSLVTAKDPGAAFFEFAQRMIVGAAASQDLVDAILAADLGEASLIMAAKGDLNQAAAKLLARAQRNGAVRKDIRVDELMILFSGAVTALRQRPGETHLQKVVFEVLRDGLQADAAGRTG